MKRILIVFQSFLFLSANGLSQQSDFPKLTGPYLGQKPPGMVPDVFAPGIVSSDVFVDFKLSFSPDGKECYFYRLSYPSEELIPTIFFTKMDNGVWTEPVKWPISQGARAFHPCVSSDNQWILFYWQFGPEQARKTGYYASARTDAGWSIPQYAGRGMYLTSDNSGQLYTTDAVWGKQPKFYLAKVTFRNGVFTEYERLIINPHYENQTHPCIAPDGRYIIFDIEAENGGLFVSFKDEDGNWCEAIDLTRHGFEPGIRGAYISPDGKYLFFSVKEDIWWVDAGIIESLRPSSGIPRQQLEISQEERNGNELQPPDRVMDAAGVSNGMIIGEVGSGKGRYTVYLARRVGPEGKVYANDIDEKSLAFLKDHCNRQGFYNVETILGTTDDPCFPQGQVDIVFMTWVYHHLEHPVALLRNIIPSLKPGGTVVIVDPDPVKNRGGRSPENRSRDQIRRQAGEAGFEVVRIERF